MSENGEVYTAGKNFTLPPAVTGGANLTSVEMFLFTLDVMQTHSITSKYGP